MLTFRPADPAAQVLIDRSVAASPSKLRALLGGGVSAVSDVLSTLSSTPDNRVLPPDEPPSRPFGADASVAIWTGSATISFAEAEVIARQSGIQINSGSLPVTIGGAATNVTGNLELFADHLVFEPHDSWRRRQVDVMRIDTDEPILVGGILAGQQGPRALVVTVRPSGSPVTFRLGLALRGLEQIITNHQA